MTVQDRIDSFARRYRKQIIVSGIHWTYYRLGSGPAIFWLTGGLRRAALGFAFLEMLAARHTIIAPDYPPVKTFAEFEIAFDSILRTEGIENFALAGQSYGGLLAQAYLSHHTTRVERLILSSSGPAGYGRGWLLAEYLAIAAIRFLPEAALKRLLLRGLLSVVTAPDAELAEWRAAVTRIVQSGLCRAEAISHFAVAGDIIWKRRITPSAFRGWQGRVIVLSARNDPTQKKDDLRGYQRLFECVEVTDLGAMGHTAAIYDPQKYVDILVRALA